MSLITVDATFNCLETSRGQNELAIYLAVLTSCSPALCIQLCSRTMFLCWLSLLLLSAHFCCFVLLCCVYLPALCLLSLVGSGLIARFWSVVSSLCEECDRIEADKERYLLLEELAEVIPQF